LHYFSNILTKQSKGCISHPNVFEASSQESLCEKTEQKPKSVFRNHHGEDHMYSEIIMKRTLCIQKSSEEDHMYSEIIMKRTICIPNSSWRVLYVL